MEIKAELLYPYTEKEKTDFIINQNHRLGYEIKEVERTVEYEEKVLEFEEVEEEQPIYNDEGEIIGYEIVIVKKPIMITVEEEIQVPIYDEETGEIIGYETQIIEKEIQKFHYETREMVVIDLQAWGKSQEDIIEERREQFKKEFFLTSIGYIRRSVSMKDGSHKDFLSDLLPTISMAVTMGQPVKVIAYDEPDFTQEVIDWEEYQHNEDVTPQFIQECFMQLQADFGVVNKIETIEENNDIKIDEPAEETILDEVEE